MDYTDRPQHPQFQKSPINVSANISFGPEMIYEYRRTSVKTADDKYHHHLSKDYDHNTIFARGVSAYKRNDILGLVKFLIENGSSRPVIRIMDETRFSRNTTVTMMVYDYLMTNNENIILEIGGKRYDYVKDYYSKLRQLFHASELSSIEKSRISKKFHETRRGMYSNKKVLREHFINMMFVIGGDINAVKEMLLITGIRSLSVPVLNKWYQKHRSEILSLMKKKEYTYAKCCVTGDYFVAPAKLSTRQDLFFKGLGFGDEKVMRAFHTPIMNLHYLSFPAEDYEQSDGMEEEDEEVEEENSDIKDVDTLIEMYQKKEISEAELIVRMSELELV